MQIARRVAQFETMRRRQRQHDVVLGRSGLQFEIELAAEPLAQGEAPGAINPAAIGRMDDELHAARFVEEAFEHDRFLGGQAAERRMRRGEIFDQLLGGRSRNANIDAEPFDHAFAIRVPPKSRRRFRRAAAIRTETVRRCGQAPRRARTGSSAACRAHLQRAPDRARPEDAIGAVAELENVAGHALDGEILVDGTDRLIFRLEDNLIIGRVGDRAARGQRGQPRPAPSAQQMIDGVVSAIARRAGRGAS